MNKDLKSLIISFSIVLLYVYASVGIVYLLWHTKNGKVLDARIKFLMYMVFILTVILLVGSYHILGDQGSTLIFQGVIFFHIAYLFIGSVYNLFSKSDK